MVGNATYPLKYISFLENPQVESFLYVGIPVLESHVVDKCIECCRLRYLCGKVNVIDILNFSSMTSVNAKCPRRESEHIWYWMAISMQRQHLD